MVSTPLKILVSWDDDIPNIWKNIHVPNHRPELIYLWGDTRPCNPHARDCYEQREQMDMQPARLAYSLGSTCENVQVGRYLPNDYLDVKYHGAQLCLKLSRVSIYLSHVS